MATLGATQDSLIGNATVQPQTDSWSVSTRQGTSHVCEHMAEETHRGSHGGVASTSGQDESQALVIVAVASTGCLDEGPAVRALCCRHNLHAGTCSDASACPNHAFAPPRKVSGTRQIRTVRGASLRRE